MRRRTSRALYAALVPGVLAVAALLVGGWVLFSQVKDRHDRAAEGVAAKARFAVVRAAISERMHQSHPVEFGAVWETHDKRICGLVNAEGSFGGLAGMIGFFTDGPNLHYGLDRGDAVAFGRIWAECGADMWVEILPGSTQQGFCATRAGARHCHLTSERHIDGR